MGVRLPTADGGRCRTHGGGGAWRAVVACATASFPPPDAPDRVIGATGRRWIQMPDLVPVKRGTPAAKDDKQAAEPGASSLPQRYWRSDPFFAPFREFDELWDRTMSRFFGGPAGAGWTGNWAPLVDLEETDSEWIFEVELPGVDRDDVRVEVTDSELSINGETKERERAGVLRHRTRR